MMFVFIGHFSKPDYLILKSDALTNQVVFMVIKSGLNGCARNGSLIQAISCPALWPTEPSHLSSCCFLVLNSCIHCSAKNCQVLLVFNILIQQTESIRCKLKTNMQATDALFVYFTNKPDRTLWNLCITPLQVFGWLIAWVEFHFKFFPFCFFTSCFYATCRSGMLEASGRRGMSFYFQV